MKKKISGILMVSLLVATMLPVFAATGESTINQGDTNKSQEVIVSYNIGENYTVTIPANFSLALEENATPISVSASDVKIADGKTLKVTMTSANGYNDGYKVTYEDSDIGYWIKKGTSQDSINTEVTGATVDVLAVTSGTTSGATYLKFYTTDQEIAGATQAGAHEDTLTFTCGVE